MTLIKRSSNLFPEFPSLLDEFKGFLDWPNMGMERPNMPAVNICESENSYDIEVAVPGMKKDDFNLNLDNNTLTISCEKKEEHEERNDKGKYTRREFSYSSFSRSFTLPENDVDVDHIDAKYEDGVLTINLPKREEVKPKPVKTIHIN